jgi:hypothetical protein
MKRKSDRSEPPRRAPAGTKADLRELRGNSSATVGELRDFLRELKGRSPQEMLGLVATSGLFRATLISTVVVAGAILVFTAIPYLLAGREAEAPVADESAAAGRETAVPEKAEAADEPAPGPIAPLDEDADPLSPLGVGGERSAPPDRNPLENQTDDFLKDLE